MRNKSIPCVLFFLVLVLVRVALDDRIPDDATTIALKHAGVYSYFKFGACAFFGLVFLWLVREERRMDERRAELRRLDELRGQMLREDHYAKMRARLRSERSTSNR